MARTVTFATSLGLAIVAHRSNSTGLGVQSWAQAVANYHFHGQSIPFLVICARILGFPWQTGPVRSPQIFLTTTQGGAQFGLLK